MPIPPTVTLPSSSSSKQLAGPVRPLNNSRLHALQKPYDRPVSTAGGQDGPRPVGLPRSGSESSLFGGLKSMLYKPIASLFGTPARPSKKDRDDTSSFGDGASIRAREDDDEMDLSPTFRRETKRLRRDSPPRRAGSSNSAGIGRAVTGTMVPPTLPPFLDLTPTKRNPGLGPPSRSSTTKGINFSRPLLPTSASMSYLDPPVSALGGSPVRKTPTRRMGGGLSRSSARLDLSTMDEAPVPVEKEQNRWSSWQVDRVNGTVGSSAAGPSSTRRGTQLGQLPSQSPFSTARPATASAMPRSTTSLQLDRSVSTSRSMAHSGRSVSGLNLADYGAHRERQLSETPSRMSVDAPSKVGRESSVLDWYMTDRWTSIRSHPHREQSVASTRAQQPLPTVRKGQMVWDSEAGFVRADRLAPEPTQPLLQNDAERILHALESMRTPLTDARSSAELRKAVNVPLATASTSGDSARSRKTSVSSVMISPYGRRRERERAGKSEKGGMRQLLARKEAQRAEDDATSAWSKSDASMAGSQAESEEEHLEEEEEEEEEEERTPTPPPAPTPRRSRRTQRRSPSPLPPTSPPRSTTTPKASKGKGKVAVPTITTTSTTPVKSPPKQPAKELPADSYQPGKSGQAGSSLRAKSTQSSRQHTPAPSVTANGHGSGRFSAREDDLPEISEIERAAKISLPSFSGISFAGFDKIPGKDNMTDEIADEDSRASSDLSLAPNDGPSLMSRLSPAPPVASAPLSAPPTSPSKPSLGLRAPGINSRPRASSPLANNSITAPPPSPPTPTTATDASAQPLSKPAPPFSFGAPTVKADEGPKKTLGFGIGKPPAPVSSPAPPTSSPGSVPNFFSGATTPAPPASLPGSNLKFSFGASPATPPAAPMPAPTFSFGSSKPASAAASPAAEAPNPFAGVGAPAKPSADAPNPFAGVGPSITPTPTPFAGSATAAPPAAPVFGGFGVSKSVEPPKPAEQPKSTPFSFGATATPSASTPTATPAPSFSGFGSTSKPAESAPSAPVAPPASSPFSFGAPAKPAEPAVPAAAPAPSSTPSFGFAQSKPAAPASNGFSSTPAPGFGAPASPAPAPAATFSFGAPAKEVTPAAVSPAIFSFGAAKPAAGSAFGNNIPSSPFGAPSSTTPASSGTPGGFGSAASATPSTGFSFGAPKPATAAPTSFGASKSVTSPTPASAPTFGFGAPSAQSSPFGGGAPASSPAAVPTFSFGASAAQPSPGFGTPAPMSSGGFGAPAAPAPTSNGFGFGASGGTPSTAAPSFGFGASAATPISAAAPASNGFSFQSPPPVAPAASFSFGAAPSTTPAAAPPAQFSFGAAASGPARFGSPAPGSPAPEGGFSFGAAGGDAPGSPGGRKIKPLRARKK